MTKKERAEKDREIEIDPTKLHSIPFNKFFMQFIAPRITFWVRSTHAVVDPRTWIVDHYVVENLWGAKITTVYPYYIQPGKLKSSAETRIKK